MSAKDSGNRTSRGYASHIIPGMYLRVKLECMNAVGNLLSFVQQIVQRELLLSLHPSRFSDSIISLVHRFLLPLGEQRASRMMPVIHMINFDNM